MRLKKFAAAALLGVAALGVSACASSITSTVSRYQAMPAPQGQTFFVVPGQGMAATGGLEFQRYAGLVAQQLQARGYTPATSPQSATMVVQLGYDVDEGQVRVVEDPFSRGYGGYGYGPYSRFGRYGGFYDPFYSPYYRSRFYYPRFGYRSPFSYGWNDPFWYDRGSGIDSYVEYHSEVDLHIRGKSGQALFDGRAQARSQTNRLDVVIPSMVEAMFAGFPGRSGETVKITVPTSRAR